MTGDQEILVSREQDVNELIKLDRKIRIINLQLPTLSNQENKDYQDKLTRYHNDCGCAVGTIITVLSIFIYLVSLVIQKINTGVLSFGLNSVAFLIGLFVVSAGVGKAIGLLNAKFRYRIIINELQRKHQFQRG